MKAFFLFLILSLVNISFAVANGVVYPGAVTVHDFQTEKVIYKPGEPVRFTAAFTASGQAVDGKVPPLTLEVWIERELEPPFLAVTKTVELERGKQQTQLVLEKGGGDVYGHRATLRCRDAFGRVLAEAETLFDVASDWAPVMRLAAMGAAALAYPDQSQENINATVAMLRGAYLNALEMFYMPPTPYVLAPKEKEWLAFGSDTRRVSGDVLRLWSKALHGNGMKYILYNEMTAITGPDEWKIWDNSWPSRKVVTTYYADKGMFTPNLFKVQDQFAEQLAESIRQYGWDGILLDSVGGVYWRTAEGFSKDGKRITSLTPSEIAHQFLDLTGRKARVVNPDFHFLSQYTPSPNLRGIADSSREIFADVMRRAEKLGTRQYSQVNDIYTIEFDSHNEPRDGRYPLTYETMTTVLNSIVTATERPLMAWGFFATPDYDEYSVAFARPYLAAHFAARTQVHDHFDFYGGAVSGGKGAPVSRAIIRYNRFMARFSYYLTSPKLRWIPEPDEMIRVTASRPLFWDKTVYERTTVSGQRQLIINLLNLPDDHHVLGQKQIPPMAQNIALRLPADKPMRAAYFLNADDESLRPLALVPEKNADGSTTWHLPPLECWGLVVMVER